MNATSPKLNLRKAALSDKEDVLAWRNDLETRAYSFQPQIVSEKEHEKWFSKLMQDKKRLLLIAFNGEKKVGAVRYDWLGEGHYEVNINLAPSMRGKGFGTELLKQSLTWVKGRVIARVKEDNQASIHAFEKAGYVTKGQDKGFILFEITAS